ncbi:MAG: hypothetical protein AB8G17_12390 [Gammaproteobacteria bacterium]
MSQPELFLILTLVAALMIHACVLNRRARRQAADLDRLSAVLKVMTREHLEEYAAATRGRREARDVTARLDALESRAAGGQRIDSAMRVAKQGAANPAVLKDLGLSEAEASLLLRLHSMGAQEPEAKTVVSEPASARLPGQAASLAKLLANVNAA